MANSVFQPGNPKPYPDIQQPGCHEDFIFCCLQLNSCDIRGRVGGGGGRGGGTDLHNTHLAQQEGLFLTPLKVLSSEMDPAQ
jgi:hypothetical protein